MRFSLRCPWLRGFDTSTQGSGLCDILPRLPHLQKAPKHFTLDCWMYGRHSIHGLHDENGDSAKFLSVHKGLP